MGSTRKRSNEESNVIKKVTSSLTKEIRWKNNELPLILKKTKQKSWIFPLIRVRIVDEWLEGGLLYNKKAQIVDVPSPSIADICLEDSDKLVQGVNQSQLETVVP